MRPSTSWNQANGSIPASSQEVTKLRSTAAVLPPLSLPKNVQLLRLCRRVHNRKNALFYKTMNGARVGDLFMSLIHTCELNQVNPFDYLTVLLRILRK